MIFLINTKCVYLTLYGEDNNKQTFLHDKKILTDQ